LTPAVPYLPHRRRELRPLPCTSSCVSSLFNRERLRSHLSIALATEDLLEFLVRVVNESILAHILVFSRGESDMENLNGLFLSSRPLP
jgi:hypothetical protein